MMKKIMITGASSGLGKACAMEFARRGYALGLTARRLDQLEQIKQDITAKYPHIPVEIRMLDVTQYATIPEILRDLANHLGGLDIVFANAGIGLGGKAGKSPFENVRKTIETNLIGAMATVDAAVAYFLEQGSGQIVGTSSVAAFRGFPGNAAYCASKSGFSTYLEGVRGEVAQKKISVTILHPGFIDTPINDTLPNRPFVVPVEKGAIEMVDLIEKKVKSSTVPRMPWSMIGMLLKTMPDAVLGRIK
ncbi:MAG: SDR family oxidoreductase [SAR324 cluster bacterium]|nr:SDR family oxidoreductase [SAR324 cluster bacterium]